MIRMSIRRPVAVAMTYGAVAALGAFAWQNIAIEMYPETDLPRLSVGASWAGSSPETVEAFLTSPLESEVQQVRGVESIISDSQEGSASIAVEFDRDTDMDFARLELAERITTIREELPRDARVSVSAYVPQEFQEQNQPLLVYQFTGPYIQEALYKHLEDVVIPELQQVDGVAQASASGGRNRLLEIRLDEEQVTSLGLDYNDVRNRIQGLDLVQEAGVVREGDREWTVTIVNRPQSAEDIRTAILTTANGTLVRVADVATVHDTYEEARSYTRINGSPALTLRIQKEIGANSVRVADDVKARIGELERLSPFGSRFILQETQDQSQEIRKSLTDLKSRAMISAVVIFVVLLLFLRSFRSAGMIFATIVFSVLIALNLIYFGGLSLNLLTLMGLAMGFGLIVDNSIVVLENVFRRWQGGEEARSAADHGTREVALPILASTATTLIVFVPFVYLQGELRVFYVPLAIVVALTLVASLFVAFSFIPALSARLLAVGGVRRMTYSVAVGQGGGAAAEGAEGDPAVSSGGGGGEGPAPGAQRRAPIYVRFYSALVGFNLRHPWLTVMVTVICLGGSWYLFDKYVDRGRLFGGYGAPGRSRIDIRINLPRGSNLERSDQLARFFEDKLTGIGEVEEYDTQVSDRYAYIQVYFPDSLEYTAVPVAIKEEMFAYSLTFTGAEVRVTGFGPSFYGGGGSAPNYRITVQGYNYERVRDIAEDLGRRLLRITRVQDVDTNASSGYYTRDRATEFTINLDRTALARHDLSVSTVLGGIQSFIGGVDAGSRTNTIKIGGDELHYSVKIRDAEDVDVVALREAILPLPGGRGIRLGDIMAVESREVLSRIHREDQQYHRTVAYEFRGPPKLGDIYHERIIESTEVPPGYLVKADDRYYWSTEERNQIFMVLLVSILLIYMVTAALFESLRQPLCVLFTVPMALIGVFMIFFYSGATFTREAYIGVIMMGGIVVNGAILLVDHVNRVRASTDLSLTDAILRGTLERVRPILMTTVTTVLGLLPLVLYSETADANIWNALGFALIGGLLSSTVFVLTTTPALYYLFEGPLEKKRAWEARFRDEGEAAPTGMDGEEPAPQPA